MRTLTSQTRAKHWVKVPDDEVGHEAFHGPHLQFLLQVMSLVTVCLILRAFQTKKTQSLSREGIPCARQAWMQETWGKEGTRVHVHTQRSALSHIDMYAHSHKSTHRERPPRTPHTAAASGHSGTWPDSPILQSLAHLWMRTTALEDPCTAGTPSTPRREG